MTLFLFSLNTYGINRSEEIDNDEIVRLNPELGTGNIHIGVEKTYPFIRYDLNHIEMNDDDWTILADKLEQSRTNGCFTFVHIGDSHIQADGNTGRVRTLFQEEYGNPGRGIIIPFRLAGTNEPLDYVIHSSSAFQKATLMRLPWPTKMGLTGVSLQPESQNFSFDLKIKSPCGFFTVLSDGNLSVDEIISEGRSIGFESENVTEGVNVSLEEDCNEFTV